MRQTRLNNSKRRKYNKTVDCALANEAAAAAAGDHTFVAAVSSLRNFYTNSGVEQLLWCVRPFWSWYVPALQSVQEVTFEAVEYFPPTHSVHVVAPALVPVSVIEPELQLAHDNASIEVEYLPHPKLPQRLLV